MELDHENRPGRDVFEWSVYEPAELARLAADAGLELIASCSGFDARRAADGSSPRVQLVLERA